MRYTLIFFFILWFQVSVHAKYLEFFVRVRDYETSEVLTNAYGEVFQGTEKISSVKMSKGELFFKLEYDTEYRIEVADELHEKLTFQVNTHMKEDVKKYVYKFVTNVNLVLKKEGFKIQYAQDPTIKVSYDKQKDGFSMNQKFSPSYTYVPDTKSNLPKVPEKPKETPKAIKDSIPSKPTLALSRPEQKARDFEKRVGEAKKDRTQIDLAMEKEKEREFKARQEMALRRRSFMEEVADSHRSYKMITYEHSEKRLP